MLSFRGPSPEPVAILVGSRSHAPGVVVSEKRIRPTAAQWALWVVWFGFLSFAVWALTPWPWPFLVAWVILLGLARALIMAQWGVTVSARGLMWAGRHGRQLDWADVAAVDVLRDRWHSRVVVRDNSGRVFALNAPTTGFLNWDANFQKKVEFLKLAHDEGRLQGRSARG